MDNIEQIYSHEFQFVRPVLYPLIKTVDQTNKKPQIKIYPIMYEQNWEFTIGIQCLLTDTMDYFNIEYATLPRLYFITEVLKHYDDENWICNNKIIVELYNCLLILLDLVFKDQPHCFVLINNNLGIRVYTDETKNFFVDINSKKFEDIRQIILHQNGYDYSDEFIHNDIKKYIYEQEKASDDEVITSEDNMDCVMIEMKIYDENILAKMSMRRFNRFLTKIISRDSWKIQTTASLSGMVTFKEKIPFWLVNQTKKSRLEKYFKNIKVENPVIL